MTPMAAQRQNERSDGRMVVAPMKKAHRSVIEVTAMDTPCD